MTTPHRRQVVVGAVASVQAAIAQGRPLIAGMEPIAETRPLGGQGLG